MLHRENDLPARIIVDGIGKFISSTLYHTEKDKYPGFFHSIKSFICGTPEWWVNGELHRENGPAKIMTDGTEIWYHKGKIHRDYEPAVINHDSFEYWINGIFMQTIEKQHKRMTERQSLISKNI